MTPRVDQATMRRTYADGWCALFCFVLFCLRCCPLASLARIPRPPSTESSVCVVLIVHSLRPMLLPHA